MEESIVTPPVPPSENIDDYTMMLDSALKPAGKPTETSTAQKSIRSLQIGYNIFGGTNDKSK
jgi:hypothetical protein